MRILFTHCWMIVDENTEYLDGAVLVEDDKIIKVFPHSTKIKEELIDIKEIDIKGNILRPAYFDTHYINESKGVSSYLLNITDEIIDNNDSRCLGYFLDVTKDYNIPIGIMNDVKGIVLDLNNDNKYLLNFIKDKNIKVLLGNSDIDYEDINIEYDGIRNILFNMKDLNSHKPSLANAAFIDNKYVEFNVDITDSILKLLLKNISRNKLILISNSKTIHESVLKLKELKVSNTDILVYTCLNAYKLYGLDNYYGSIRKGKYADFIIVNPDYEILFEYKKGELINE